MIWYHSKPRTILLMVNVQKILVKLALLAMLDLHLIALARCYTTRWQKTGFTL
jgi:hypothetical protein